MSERLKISQMWKLLIFLNNCFCQFYIPDAFPSAIVNEEESKGFLYCSVLYSEVFPMALYIFLDDDCEYCLLECTITYFVTQLYTVDVHVAFSVFANTNKSVICTHLYRSGVQLYLCQLK